MKEPIPIPKLLPELLFDATLHPVITAGAEGITKKISLLEAVLLVTPSLTVNVAPYNPGELYVTIGFCNVDVDGVPPGNVHDQLVGFPEE